MRPHGFFVAGLWTAFGVYTLAADLQIGSATAALLCGLLAWDAIIDARRR